MKSIGPSQYRIFRKFYRNAAREMCKDCADFILPNSKILDFGCGSGTVGKEFGMFFRSSVLGVDIIDNRIEDIEFIKYNGEDLSFLEENYFDVVLINFVLHHCKNPKDLLKEIRRVSNNTIILYENLPEGPLSKMMCYYMGCLLQNYFRKIKREESSLQKKSGKIYLKKFN